MCQAFAHIFYFSLYWRNNQTLSPMIERQTIPNCKHITKTPACLQISPRGKQWSNTMIMRGKFVKLHPTYKAVSDYPYHDIRINS